MHGIDEAETRAEAEKAFEMFVATDKAKDPQATEWVA